MRPPLLWITIAFGTGLAVGVRLVGDVGTWAVGVPVALGTLLLSRRAAVAGAMGIALLAGLVWGEVAVRRRAASCAGLGERGALRAVIVRLLDPAPVGGGVVDGDAIGGPCRGAVRLRWPDGRDARGGSTWIVAGRWLGPVDRGILALRRVRLLDAERRGRGALRDRLSARAAALFGHRAPLVEALVTGRRTELDPAVRERFAAAGLAHLLAISGLHVGFFAAWVALGLRLLRLPARARLVAGAIAVFAYVWLLGFPAPATRAAAMLAAAAAARLRQRIVTPRGTIALAVLFVLAVDPWAVRSVGAWLSVAAVSGVIWASRAAAREPRLVRLLAPATAATLLTAPITAYAFGTVAPVGVLANLVAIPLAGVAVPGLMIALALSWLVPSIAHVIASGAGLGLALIDLTARGAAAVPGGHVVMVAGGRAAAFWAMVLGAAWWLWRGRGRRWVLAARAAFLATLVLGASLAGATSLDDCRCVQIHFLDVGQGDAALLRTATGRWILIDGGPRTPVRDAGRSVVIPYLRRHGAPGLALVVATHGDADHLGGIPAVLRVFPPRLVLEPGEPLGRPLYLEFLAAVEASGAAWHAARSGDRFEIDGLRLDVVSPDSAWLAEPLEVNEHGVVVVVTYGRTRVFFQADAGLPVEWRLRGRVGPVALLKIGHHGSRSATGDAWLDELRPGDAVISVGARNTYGHPAPEVLARLRAHGIRIWRTDEAGDITFEVDTLRGLTHVRRDD
ncbi:MAG: DNA internalization-related competence protein ComEC/Rec2 [Gemmatimonadetes bacterium]|nr:MAG: DNA internalization-related competence protein ComEC/Rec2 [Gemmatimonadota bacterium]PYP63656.1 MAG: DNA internalization-related competence protein ComEC/Rec2 [Gemmatimonadota bacterium]